MKTLRTAAWTLISLALALLGADIITSLEQGRPIVRTTREILNLVPGVAIDPVATSGLAGVLNLAIDVPLWAILGTLGLVATIFYTAGGLTPYSAAWR